MAVYLSDTTVRKTPRVAACIGSGRLRRHSGRVDLPPATNRGVKSVPKHSTCFRFLWRGCLWIRNRVRDILTL